MTVYTFEYAFIAQYNSDNIKFLRWKIKQLILHTSTKKMFLIVIFWSLLLKNIIMDNRIILSYHSIDVVFYIIVLMPEVDPCT